MDKKQIDSQINYLETLQKLTQAYAEISSSRMMKVRGTVLSTRDFLENLDEIFKEVRDSYRSEVEKLSKKSGKSQKLTFLAHNGKTVSVYLSANTGLYGEIMQKTFNKFMEEVETKGTEATIVGRLGLSLFLSRQPKMPYTYFDYPDYGGDKAKLAEIVRHLVQYESIHVFFGKFHNVVIQEPDSVDISAQTPISTLSDKITPKKDVVKYIFEPTLEEILMFFESEMFGSVFEQAMNESQLAKFSSRMLAMDRASQNIKDSISGVKFDGLKLSHRLLNRKQINSVSGLFATEYSQDI
ncbi:MAG: F0F1 ATP synthase subunit gamma [Patescibacteria group bacterium]